MIEDRRLKPPPDDPKWPKASAWIGGESFEKTGSSLAVVGVPLNIGLIQGAYDKGPEAIRQALDRFGSFDVEHNNDLRSISVDDQGDLPGEDCEPVKIEEPIAKIVSEC